MITLKLFMDKMPFKLVYEIFSLLDGRYVIIYGNINSHFRQLISNDWIRQRSIVSDSKLNIGMISKLYCDPSINMTSFLLSRSDHCYNADDKVFWWCIQNCSSVRFNELNQQSLNPFIRQYLRIFG